MGLVLIDQPGLFGVPDLGLLLTVLGAYMFAREAGRTAARGGALHLFWDVLAVALVVLATALPRVSTVVAGNVATAFKGAVPAGLLILGIGALRDGGWKILVGLAFIIIGFATYIGLPITAPTL
jgi:hypothetical protein